MMHKGLATEAQLMEMISGNTLQGSTRTSKFAEYYAPDGKLRGEGYSGTWKVEGNLACMDYGKGYSCWTGRLEGASSIWYLNGEVDAAGMMFPGNPNDF